MHIIVMFVLIGAGFWLGDRASWVLGLPVLLFGLYVGFGDWGGKKGARFRATGEEIFFLIGLLSIPFIIITNIFN